MELKDIVSISGVSGIHKIVGKTKSGLILETLGTGKRFPTSIQDKVSVLEDISMYTENGDMKLQEVLINLNEKEKAGETIPDAKAEVRSQRDFVSKAIRLDNERVYDSDIKKLLGWYHLLKSELDFSALAKAQVSEETKEAETETVAEGEEKHKEKKSTPKAPKNVTPKNIAPKTNTKGTGAKTAYRPKAI